MSQRQLSKADILFSCPVEFVDNFLKFDGVTSIVDMQQTSSLFDRFVVDIKEDLNKPIDIDYDGRRTIKIFLRFGRLTFLVIRVSDMTLRRSAAAEL